jgi:phosphohistidine phosphatase
MKTLYLVRHADSPKNIKGIKDWERPVSEKGIRISHEVFRTLKITNPDRIISSYAFRALNTAFIIAHEMDHPFTQIQIETTLYKHSAKSIIAFLKKQSNTLSSIMLVGHNPSLTRLYKLLTNETYELPKSSVFTIRLDINKWSELKTGIPTGKAMYA